MNLNQAVRKELEGGGAWLGAARTWMQWNIPGGDTLTWSSTHPVTIPFCKLQELALEVAAAAIEADRKRHYRAAE